MGRPFEVNIEAFRASDNPKRCRQYLAGHKKILDDHGFDHFVTGRDYWVEDPNVLVVMASSKHDKNRIFGGVRFEKRHPKNLIPLEKVLNNIDPEVSPLVQQSIPEGTGEMCGLWNSKEVIGKNISLLLAVALYASLPQMGINSSFIFNARYTFRITRRLGFRSIEQLEQNGVYAYPNEAFKAYLWKHENIFDLRRLSKLEKEKVESLRRNPIQKAKEFVYSKGLIVNYTLEI